MIDDITNDVSTTATGTALPAVTLSGISSGICNQVTDVTDKNDADNWYDTQKCEEDIRRYWDDYTYNHDCGRS